MVSLWDSQIASEAMLSVDGCGMVRCKAQCSVDHSSFANILERTVDCLIQQQVGQVYLPYAGSEGIQPRFVGGAPLDVLHFA